MPAEFDILVAELAFEDFSKALTPLQRDGFMRAIAQTAFGSRPHERRVMDAAFAKAQNMPLSSDKAAALDGKPGAKKSAPEPLSKARPAAPISTAQLLAAARSVESAVRANEATFARMATASRVERREAARERARGTLAKALAAFHDGKITSHQVAIIEARVHAIDATASRAGGAA